MNDNLRIAGFKSFMIGTDRRSPCLLLNKLFEQILTGLTKEICMHFFRNIDLVLVKGTLLIPVRLLTIILTTSFHLQRINFPVQIVY